MLYFAYGSNMDWKQMKDRCPSAKFVCVAKLKNYKLAFTRECKKGYGVSDIIRANRSHVWGVVYQIGEDDLGCLAHLEGYQPQRLENAYQRMEIMVFFKEGDTEKPLTVSAYEVVNDNKTGKNLKTSKDYKNKIIRGARFWKLPPNYMKKLKGIKVK